MICGLVCIDNTARRIAQYSPTLPSICGQCTFLMVCKHLSQRHQWKKGIYPSLGQSPPPTKSVITLLNPSNTSSSYCLASKVATSQRLQQVDAITAQNQSLVISCAE
mmetsp:Transcript_17092/g.30515  ORF Transcript_17092/g.30515 Transcript_17092/m.30515 type:complete len:107 (-) Transcript_17092:8-328(-)